MNPQSLPELTELLLLKPETSRSDVAKACAQARQHGFRSVCVNGSRVIQALALLEETEVKIATVVGFPLGAMDADAKRFETEAAVDNGAQEINVVLNIGWLKDGDPSSILRELRDVIEAADERPVGVILETPLLTRDEKIIACHLIQESAAKAVVTCTGLAAGRAAVEDVKLLRQTLGAKFDITAAGGIFDTQSALVLIEAGATRIAIETGFIN